MGSELQDMDHQLLHHAWQMRNGDICERFGMWCGGRLGWYNREDLSEIHGDRQWYKRAPLTSKEKMRHMRNDNAWRVPTLILNIARRTEELR